MRRRHAPVLCALAAAALAASEGADAPGLLAELAPVTREAPRYLQSGQKPQHRATVRAVALDLAEERFAGLPARHWFALRLRGSLIIPAAGAWTFALIADDSGRLTIDGRVVIDNPGLHGPLQARGTMHLAAGRHDVQIDHVQGEAGAVLWLGWAQGDAPVEPVPAQAFAHAAEPGVEPVGEATLADAMRWDRRLAQAAAVFAEDAIARRRDRLWRSDAIQLEVAEAEALRRRLQALEQATQAAFAEAQKRDEALAELHQRHAAARQRLDLITRQLAEVGR